MHYLLLTEDADGVSSFSERDIPLSLGDFAPPAPAMYLSEGEAASKILFLVLPPGWTGDWHPSPRAQVAFCMSGTLRVEAGNGEIRDVESGGIWRMEDVAGRGHKSSVVGTENVELAIVQF